MFNEVISIDCHIPEAYNNLGLTLQKQGRFDEAIRSSLRAIELRPAFADAHSNVALALQHMNRPVNPGPG